MPGRLLPFAAGASAWNMAVDQAILESVEASSIPTLRFYGWLEPTLSLGYFQAYEARLGHTASSSCACVRRATGGGAILHDHELTYSLVMPLAASATQRRQQLYRDVHLALIRSLADFGIRATPQRLAGRPDGQESAFLCFQRRTDEDLILSGYKIVGSAQRRSRGAVLQHGSLLLRASRCAPELPGVCDLTSKQIDAIDLVDLVAEQLSGLIGVRWNPGQLLPAERSNAERIEAERFAAVGWNRRR
jgi:lipoate-protein ligase A